MRPTLKDLKAMAERFLNDPVVSGAEKHIPDQIKNDLLASSSDYLSGYVDGVARSLTTLQKMDGALREGSAERAAVQRTMLSVTVAVSVKELLRRAEEDEAKDDK